MVTMKSIFIRTLYLGALFLITMILLDGGSILTIALETLGGIALIFVLLVVKHKYIKKDLV